MKSKKPTVKRFIVRKFIMATSASEALKSEGRVKADDCYLDEKWVDMFNRDNSPAIGFHCPKRDEEDY